MKITNEVRELYMSICHKSTKKCETYSEIDFKIKRAIVLGKPIHSKDNKKVYGYYNLRFVMDGIKVTHMYVDMDGRCYDVPEKLKDRYDKIELKIVV